MQETSMLPNYKHILIPMDLSPNSVNAFKHAVMIARRNDAKLHLLNVVPEVDAAMRSYISALMVKGGLAQMEHENEERARKILRQELEDFAAEELKDHPEDLERIETFEVVHGDPVTKILLAAERVNADMIVMGSHSKGFVSYATLGSTAQRVLRKTVRPALIVPLD